MGPTSTTTAAPQILRAISLWQPWASLWLTDDKIHETRHWPTKVRGTVLVHAAKRKPDRDLGDDELEALCARRWGGDWRATLPRGALIGSVNIIDCKRTGSFQVVRRDVLCGDFSTGRWAWEAIEKVKFSAAYPFKGRQGFFSVPAAMIPRWELP